MGRTASGVRAIRLRDGDYVVGATKTYDKNMTILTVTDMGLGRRTELTRYPMRKRGGYGVTNYKVSDEKGYVCGIRALGSDDDVILISTDGVIIRIRANDIRPLNRYASGVRVMRLTEGSKVVSFTRTEHDDSEETEAVEQAHEEDIRESEAEEASEVLTDDDGDTDDDEQESSDNTEE